MQRGPQRPARVRAAAVERDVVCAVTAGRAAQVRQRVRRRVAVAVVGAAAGAPAAEGAGGAGAGLGECPAAVEGVCSGTQGGDGGVGVGVEWG